MKFRYQRNIRVLIITLLSLLWGCNAEYLPSSTSIEKKIKQTNDMTYLTNDEYRSLVFQYVKEYKQRYEQKFGKREFDIKFELGRFLVFTDNFENKIIFTPNYKELLNNYNNLSSYERQLNSYQTEKLSPNKKILLHTTIHAHQSYSPFSSIQEQKLLLEQIIAHELGHLYYINRHRPHFLAELNLIGAHKFNVGFMRDELYAEFISLLAMKEKYRDSLVFQQFLNKLRNVRLIKGLRDAIELSGNYNLYPIYKDLNLLNTYSLNKISDIEEKVDAMTLQNLALFGLGKEVDQDTIELISDQIVRYVKFCQEHQDKNKCYSYVWLSEDILNNYLNRNYEQNLKEKLLTLLKQYNIQK